MRVSVIGVVLFLIEAGLGFLYPIRRIIAVARVAAIPVIERRPRPRLAPLRSVHGPAAQMGVVPQLMGVMSDGQIEVSQAQELPQAPFPELVRARSADGLRSFSESLVEGPPDAGIVFGIG